MNLKVYQELSDLTDQVEDVLVEASQFVDVDIMPGEHDFTSALLPQQPLHSSLFMKVLSQRRNVNLVTNPSSFSINDVKFLGTAG